MATIKEIENLRLNSAQDLCKLAEMIGYGRGSMGQLQNNNGSFVSSLCDFFDDNPGAMEVVAEWILANHDIETEDWCDDCGEAVDLCECDK